VCVLSVVFMMLSDEESNLPSILLVDDNETILQMLRTLFRANGFQVQSAMNGVAALDLVQKGRCDIVICDVMMPQLGGFDFLKEVRAIPEASHIPFVFLSALAEKEEVHAGLKSGVDDYVTKPFDPEHLLAVVRGKLTRSSELHARGVQLQEKFQKRVIHTLSHEFRTPLVAINTGAELLLEHAESLSEDRTRTLLEAIYRGGQRLERLVNDFMLIQQVEAGIAGRLFQERAEHMVVADLVQETMESQYDAELCNECSFSFKNQAPHQKAYLYRPQFQDVMVRIFENAAKFSSRGGAIEVQLRREDGFLVLEVHDRGIGVSSSQVEQAMEMFGQVGRETLEQQGGGLGLALVSRYIELFSGSFALHEREGGGTTAQIRIPISQSA